MLEHYSWLFFNLFFPDFIVNYLGIDTFCFLSEGVSHSSSYNQHFEVNHSQGINILITILITLIINIIITLALLHFIEVINIYDLLGISKYLFIDYVNLNDTVVYCSLDKINKFHKPINNYFQPCLDIFKYRTPHFVTPNCKSEIIKTLYDFYDMNSHIRKDNNSLLEQVNRLKPYYDNYNDLKNFFIDNNPLDNPLA